MIHFVEEETNFSRFTFRSLCFSTTQSIAYELHATESTFLYFVYKSSLRYTRYTPTHVLQTVSPKDEDNNFPNSRFLILVNVFLLTI
jgi:hypothetical protein